MKEYIDVIIDNPGYLVSLIGILILTNTFGGLVLFGSESKSSGKINKKHSLLLAICFLIVGIFLVVQNSRSNTSDNGEKTNKVVTVDTFPVEVIKEHDPIIAPEEKREEQITGKIYGPTGEAVSDAKVTIQSHGYSLSKADGSYTIDIVKSIDRGFSLSIYFEHDKYKPVSLDRPYYGGKINLYFEESKSNLE